MIGQTVGHYPILEKLGNGAISVLYNAGDARLNRDSRRQGWSPLCFWAKGKLRSESSGRSEQ